MTKQERDQVTMLLGALAEVLGQEITPARLVLLVEDIEDLPLERIKVGIALARRRCRFVPAPVELRALCMQQAPPALGPSLQAIRAERERVRLSWASAPPVPNLQAMVDSCFANAALAEKQIEATRAAIERRIPGDADIPQMRADLERHLADYRHWSGYVGYYRARVAKEGSAAVPKVGLGGDPLGGIVGMVIDRREKP